MERNLKPEKPMEQTELEQALKDARSKATLDEAIAIIIDVLHLESLFKYNTQQKHKVTALLIEIIKQDFDTILDSDVVLNALGLLDGFNNPNSRTQKTSITDRRKLFIKYSSYVEDKYQKNSEATKIYHSYKEVEDEGEERINKVIKALGNYDEGLLVELGEKLWSHKDTIHDKLNDFEEKYVDKSKKYYDIREDIVVGVNLPKLSCERRELIIKRLLRYLYFSEGEKRFKEEPPQTWRQLGLDENPGSNVFKVFLIDIIENQYNTMKIDEAEKRDILFLTFNLLEGYIRQEEANDASGFPEKRYIDYLSNSDFVKLSRLSSHNRGKYFKTSTEQLNDFTELAQSYIDELTDEILRLFRANEFNKKVSQSTKKFSEKYVFTEHKPCYTKKKFPKEIIKRRVDLLKELVHQQKEKIRAMMAPSIFCVGCVIFVVLVYVNFEKIPVKEIRLGYYERLLRPGEVDILPIEIDPPNATDKTVFIESSNNAALTVERTGMLIANTDYPTTSASENIIVTVTPRLASSPDVKSHLYITIDYSSTGDSEQTETEVNGKKIKKTLAAASKIINPPQN